MYKTSITQQAKTGDILPPAPGVLQRASKKGQHTPGYAPQSVHETLREPGQPIAAPARRQAEQRLGQDFSGVRVHSGASAAQSAQAVNALAYTVGQDIVFGAGQYAPHTREGERLLAHELTHTLQQRNTTADRAQQPLRVNEPGDSAEREAARISEGPGSAKPMAASQAAGQGGLLQRQEVNNPTPQQKPGDAAGQKTGDAGQKTDATGQKNEPAPTEKKEPPAGDLKTQVGAWLDQENFDLPAVADPPATATGERRALYGGQMRTLDAITDDVTDVLRQKNPGIKRPDVWSQVWQYYNSKKAEAEKKTWQTVVSVQYTPQYTLLSNQKIDNPAQHSFQLSGGANKRFHPAGESGTELTLQANVSLLNLSAPRTPYFYDIFQNATVSGQVQEVFNLGKDFRIPSGQWANLQASLFAQVALGAGTNYSTASGERKLFVSFLAQPSAGGQVNLNIGSFQIIVNGSVVYSFLAPTAEKNSTATHSLAVQGGIGIGGQF